jgi:hypothetical protein
MVMVPYDRRARTEIMEIFRPLYQNPSVTSNPDRHLGEEVGQVIIWGDDPLNEMSWELSQPILGKWD